MKTAAWIVAALAALVLALGAGYWLGARDDAEQGSEPMEPAQPEVLYWYDPMYPDQRFDKPGPSPFMDMALVPKYADSAGGDGDEIVRIDPATVQNLGVRTATVEHGALPAGLVVPGTLAWDQRRAYQVSARAGGVIERLHVRAPYTPVGAGQPLAELLSADWNAAIAEYRALGEARSETARALRDAARQRLRALGMEEAQIRRTGESANDMTVTVRSPADGVVSAIDVREGQQVAPGTPLMTVIGLDTIWAEAALPQAQAARVSVGTLVEATVSAIPGETFTGEVEALLPVVDPATRTQTARIVLQNSQHRLAPGMFAELRFQPRAGQAQPLVPDGAVIATGMDARVIVAEGEGRFRPVRVTTGRSAGGMTQILSGLEGGEQVVVSGQFLIDSEASLSGALQRLSEPAPAVEGDEMPAPMEHMHGHEGHAAPAETEPQR